MSRQKKKKKRRNAATQLRLYQRGSGAAQAAPLPTKRRLPRPPATTHDLSPLTEISPAAQTIAAYVRDAAVAQSLTAYSVFNDWAAMIEATLERWAINQRSLLLTGQVTPDPPEIAAVFSRVRDRRDAAAQRNPAVARLLDQGWRHTFAGVTEAAQLDLWRFYTGQSTLHPDVIGQAFLAVVEGDPAWAGYFPAWPAALEQVQSLLPDGFDFTRQRLHAAARSARQDGVAIRRDLPPEQADFEAWYTTLEPYLPPLILGPPLTDTSAVMLAAAAQFPAFLSQRGKLLFQFPPDQPPLLGRLQHINAMLYHLNGYLMAYLTAMTDVEQELQQQSVAPASGLLSDPDPGLIWGRGEEPPDEPAV
jgi:hypothetical protein